MTTPGSGQPPGQPDQPMTDPGMPAPAIGRIAVGRASVGPPVPAGVPPYPGGTISPPGGPHAAATPGLVTPGLVTPGPAAPGPATPGLVAAQPFPAQAAGSTGDARPGVAAVASSAALATGAARPLLAAAPGQRLALPETLRTDPPGPGPEGPTPPQVGSDSSNRLPRLRIGSHTASASALAQLRVSAPGTGLIIGADQDRRPVPVRLFRPEPTRATLVGGIWASQLLAFRALALGARVAVVTAEPRNWDGFGERVTGRNDRVALLPADQPLALTATARQPVLVIHDVGLASASAPQPLGPWQAQLTVLRRLDRSAVPVLHASDLVLLQRLDSGEAALVTDVLRLPGVNAQYLQSMSDDMLALVMDGAERYLWLAQTEVERQYGGAPRR